MNRKDDAEIVRMLERGEIEESDIVCTVDEEITIPADCCGDFTSILQHAKFQSERLAKLKQARLRMQVLSQVSGSSSFDFERQYMELYEDIKAHENFWFDNLFETSDHASEATPILGVLCTILRQRGDLKGCMEVMPTYIAVLKKYQQIAERSGDEDEVRNCKMLEYKLNLIRINCGVQLPDKQMAVAAFRDAAAYEKKEKALGKYQEDLPDGPDYDDCMKDVIGHERHNEVADDVVFKALSFITGQDITIRAPDLELCTCGYCEKEESMHGDFKKCSRCHDQAYCNKKCQTKDWKVHKQLCGKKNTTKLESSTLLEIANVLMKNHTATVEIRRGALPEHQKNDAKAALIKKLKQMFTGEFKHFDSSAYAGDAGTDPSFLQGLADFFAQQPGYEQVWGAFRHGYKERLEKSKKEELQKGVIGIHDDVIRERCEDIVRHFKVNCSDAFDASDLLDETRHNVLIDSLMNLMKKFIRENPKYNSFAGVFDMIDDTDFRVEMGVTIALCYDDRGPQVDAIADRLAGVEIDT